MRMWGQSKISYSCIRVWCVSEELGHRRSSRFPCVTPVVKTFPSDQVTFRILSNINDRAPLRKQPAALTRWLFGKKLHHRPPTEFQIGIWLQALRMWGVGGLQVHGICSRRLVYKEVVEVRSDYKKFYFWWCWLLRLNPGLRGEHLTIQLLWATAGLLVTRFLVYSPIYPVD